MVHQGTAVSDDLGKQKQSQSTNKHSLSSLRSGSRTELESGDEEANKSRTGPSL